MAEDGSGFGPDSCECYQIDTFSQNSFIMLLDRIELFVTVAKHQSVAKTARGMHVSPSSVSQRLKSLERDFGVKLYKRTKEGIELTKEGRILLSTAGEVLNQIDTLRRTLNPNLERVVQQRLVVGATYNPSVKYLPVAIASFQKARPDATVTFLTSYRREVEKWVRDGEVDIAIIQSPSESCMADCFTEHFAVDTVAFFAHAAHPFSRKQRLSIESLTDAPLVVREGRGTTHKMLGLVRSCGVKLNVVLRCASPDAVKAAVRNRMGIGVLFYNQIEEDVRRKELKVLRFESLPRMIGTSYIVHNTSKPLNAAAAEFLALLHDIKSRELKPVNIHELTGTGLS
jgi:DNA-binding transcriptional LysR family regulator